MITLAQKKRFLVIGEQPVDWPEGWKFPEPWPPGWPKKIDFHVGLKVDFKDDVLTVRCLDEHNEDTDIVNGQMLKVEAFNVDKKQVRLRCDPTDHFSMTGLFSINEYEAGKFGVRQLLCFEMDKCPKGHVDLDINIFGYE